jgi:hypothetical protein
MFGNEVINDLSSDPFEELQQWKWDSRGGRVRRAGVGCKVKRNCPRSLGRSDRGSQRKNSRNMGSWIGDTQVCFLITFKNQTKNRE